MGTNSTTTNNGRRRNSFLPSNIMLTDSSHQKVMSSLSGRLNGSTHSMGDSYSSFGGETASDTSSVCSSVCNKSFMSLASDVVSTTTKKTKKIKKRVRFNNNRITGKSQVKSKVQTFDKIQDPAERRAVWWSQTELADLKSADAELAENSSDAEAYLQRAFEVFLGATSNKYLSVELLNTASSLDARYRGLERWHGPCSVDRRLLCEEAIHETILLHRRLSKKNKNNKAKSSSLSKGSSHSVKSSKGSVNDNDNDDGIDEEVGRRARELTENMRNLATFYGMSDALAVNDGCSTLQF